MTVKKILSALTLCCVAVPAFADCYRSEWGLDYVNGESSLGGYSFEDYTPPSETGPEPLPPTGSPGLDDFITFPETSTTEGEDYDGFAVNGEVFFSPVSCDGVPLKEAAFLGQVSSVGGSYAQLDSDDNTDLDAWRLFTRIVANSWVFEGDVSTTSVDGDFADSDVDTFRVAVGRYLGSNSQVLVAYETTEIEDIDAERLSASIKTVVSLENGMSYKVDALVGLVEQDGVFGGDDDGFDVLLTGDWYFNNQFSVGGALEFADRDSVGSLFNYSLNGTYFFTDRISLALTYRDTDDDALALFGDQLALEFTYRR